MSNRSIRGESVRGRHRRDGDCFSTNTSGNKNPQGSIVERSKVEPTKPMELVLIAIVFILLCLGSSILYIETDTRFNTVAARLGHVKTHPLLSYCNDNLTLDYFEQGEVRVKCRGQVYEMEFTAQELLEGLDASELTQDSAFRFFVNHSQYKVFLPRRTMIGHTWAYDEHKGEVIALFNELTDKYEMSEEDLIDFTYHQFDLILYGISSVENTISFTMDDKSDFDAPYAPWIS